MKHSLIDLINELKETAIVWQKQKNYTSKFIEEAKKGKNWTQWDKNVFEEYFEKSKNCIAYLGNGQMSNADKRAVKDHWIELAPHLKAIAGSQDIPLWNEYEAVKNLIKKITKKNLNVASNRMIAGLQPKLLCTECDVTRINQLVDYLRRFTDAKLSDYDPVCWEKASHSLFNLLKTIDGGNDDWTLAHISWKLLEVCQNRFGRLPRKWLAYANREMFHHAEALHEIGFICWTMYRTNFEIGDEVYLFMSDERRIRFKTKVVADNFVRGDGKYRVDGGVEDNLTYKLEFAGESTSEGLNEKNLLAHGFNGGRSIQHPIYNNPVLLEYIAQFFQDDDIPDWDEISTPETVFEGAKKEITVNSYERNHEARAICIAAHGCKCAVCGMDFEIKYGDLGRGYIHVHHIVPISTIGREYELDPVKDLVPVCPNCHAMLHRHPDKVLTIDELKRIIKK